MPRTRLLRSARATAKPKSTEPHHPSRPFPTAPKTSPYPLSPNLHHTPAPPPPPSPISTTHTSLPTFLAYAAHVSLAPTSPTYIGTHYEYTCASSLSRLQMRLTRVGGRADNGVDLVGHWAVPSALHALRVLVQCKALSRAPGPHLVRELEGAFAGAPVGWRASRSGGNGGDASSRAGRGNARKTDEEEEHGKGASIIGLLACPLPATKGVRDALARSAWPLGFVCVGLNGTVRQMVWNERARRAGLEGLAVEVRYVAADQDEEGAGLGEDGDGAELKQEVVLTWRGEVVSDAVSGGVEGVCKNR
ncbi:MAG: hypothetical protein M1819_005328 [Sarea resinae]|nr:MAG: hypothetical protein M1819_005328 [Sarea resinae]